MPCNFQANEAIKQKPTGEIRGIQKKEAPFTLVSTVSLDRRSEKPAGSDLFAAKASRGRLFWNETDQTYWAHS